MARVAEQDREIAHLHRSVDVEKTGSMVLETRCIAELAKNEDLVRYQARHAELTLLTEKVQQVLAMVGFTVHPSPQISRAVVEQHNSVLSTQALLEHTAVAVMLNNEAITDNCRRSFDIERQTHANLSRLVAQVMSLLTV